MSNPFPAVHSESPCKRQPGSVRAKGQKVLILYVRCAKYVFFHTGARAIWQAWASSCDCLRGLQSCQITASSAQESIRPAVFTVAVGCVSQAMLPTSARTTSVYKHYETGCAAPCPHPSDSGSIIRTGGRFPCPCGCSFGFENHSS